jgi:hypothetical protein
MTRPSFQGSSSAFNVHVVADVALPLLLLLLRLLLLILRLQWKIFL